MGINWKVRIKNKTFWLTAIPAILLLVQKIGEIFGVVLDLGGLAEQLKEVINLLFVVLAIFGIVIDPTTVGAGDSEQAMTYDKPKGVG